ncbi:hypothetical protein DM01DRAFT_1072860 [Hesseltinella vesiculosa]|uniref:F-box domain-containing protein n=1 Tax=Hesseltinella vesiculosa TaxID=101127 RepID=A0A1X2GVT0_9FUNG|nr:hypothetical protein DM01DRAFT_1072860 [Hesseltinella vesiculosa]
MMTLPAEIIADILQHLSPRHLTQTNLVCRVWSAVSMNLLYQTVYIHTTRQLESFLEALQTTSTVHLQAVRALLFHKPVNFTNTQLAMISQKCPHVDTIATVKDLTLVSPTYVNATLDQWTVSNSERSVMDLYGWPYLKRIGTMMEDKALGWLTLRHALTFLKIGQFHLDHLVSNRSLALSPCFPSLETLVLSHGYEVMPRSSMLWINKSCPRLRHLYLRDVLFAHDIHSSSNLAFINNTLESLTLQTADFLCIGWVELLADLFPSVRCLALDIHFPLENEDDMAARDGSESEDDSSVGMEGLDSDIIVILDPHPVRMHPQVFCECLQDWIKALPRLEKLVLSADCSPNAYVLYWPMDILTKAIQTGSWQCNIKHLVLEDSHVPSDDKRFQWIWCDAFVTQLESLTMTLTGPCSFDICPQPPLDPSCRAIAMASCVCSSHRFSWHLFPNLTQLHLKSSLDAMLSWPDLLVACPRLVSLHLQALSVSHQIPATPSTPHVLKHLTLVQCTLSNTSLMVSAIEHQLPHLTSVVWKGLTMNNPSQDFSLCLDGCGLSRLWLLHLKTDNTYCKTLSLYERRSGKTTLYNSSSAASTHGGSHPTMVLTLAHGDDQPHFPYAPLGTYLHVKTLFVEDILFA